MRRRASYLAALLWLAAPAAAGERRPTPPGFFDSVVLLRVYTGIRGAFIEKCTGLIVGDGAALAPAHCFRFAAQGRVIDLTGSPQSVAIFAGSDYTRGEATLVANGVSEIRPHPSWARPEGGGLDLALIRFPPGQPQPFSAELARSAPRAGERALVVGYGSEDPDQIGRKRDSQVTVIEADREEFVLDGAAGVCGGDSGAAVFSGAGTDLGAVGLISQADCQAGQAVAARIEAAGEWISRTLAEWGAGPRARPEPADPMDLGALRRQTLINGFLKQAAGFGER